MERLVVIVINWNGIDDTVACIKSLSKQVQPVDIVVVDNGSTDDSVSVLEKTKNITLIKQDNLGIAGGMNTGAKYALENGYKYFALLNNDTLVDKYWSKKLVEKAVGGNVGVVTSLMLDITGDKIDTTGEQYSIWGLSFPRGRDRKVETAPESGFVFAATGGASLYKTEVIRDIGLFDEDISAYYEDTDMCFRAQLAGWKVVYAKDAVVYHKRGESSKKIPGFTVYQTFKNLPLVYIKNVPRGLLFKIGIRFYFAYLMIYLNAIKNGSGVPATKGLLKGFLLGFKKLGERYRIQSTKKVTSKYIAGMLWDDLPPDQSGLRKLRKLFTGKN